MNLINAIARCEDYLKINQQKLSIILVLTEKPATKDRVAGEYEPGMPYENQLITLYLKNFQ